VVVVVVIMVEKKSPSSVIRVLKRNMTNTKLCDPINWDTFLKLFMHRILEGFCP
jgi:hypothetical protein